MAIELNYACAECGQLTTNWSLAYDFLLTHPDFHKMSFPEHRFKGAPKLFKMQSILFVYCVCSCMYTSSTCVQIFFAFERAVLKLYVPC